MILDVLKNAQFHVNRNPGMAKAFAFLERPDLKDLPVGTYEIDGKRVYAMVQIGAGRPREGAMLEAHREYIDIQVCWTASMKWVGNPPRHANNSIWNTTPGRMPCFSPTSRTLGSPPGPDPS
jgi:YhcH/YjgK/YiaL family protein